MTSNNDPHDHDFCLPSSSTIPNTNHHQKPRKKRTKKLVEIESYLVPSTATTLTAAKKPKYGGKKPDPSAPKITRPCSECGKKFWSWKALFGHMRCHPQRQWRGINPPPNYRRSVSPIQQSTTSNVETLMTEMDHEVASCLLMLAKSDSATLLTLETAEFGDVGGVGNNNSIYQVQDEANRRFECSSCKKVFGSHQALGGHRASHKNVKGCFAITKIDDCEVIEDHGGSGGVKENLEDNVSESKLVMELGGRKRCHCEKEEEASISSSMNQGLDFLAAEEDRGLDLNLPAPVEAKSSSSYSSRLPLDLSLGLRKETRLSE
ncbi:unnamed protein product [Dovyalis caffra]|uniref:C2H2-type domain-containing protein n=1 Tax=Dovyalis caffra TaxID=77055 RepID=A0AAV1SHD8_9ROSI|nr:unnamed protein product [Dovyalis caffra]